METGINDMTTRNDQIFENQLWEEFLPRLRLLARKLVYSSNVTSWRGQEEDVVEDITSTTLVKVIQYLHRAERIPIRSLESLGLMIAKHYFVDMRRREQHTQYLSIFNKQDFEEPFIDPVQELEEKLYEEYLLVKAARKIAGFPTKMSTAVLSDLANLPGSDIESSVLNRAFQDLGIHLQDYRGVLSHDPAERSRQSALRSLAYKCLAQTLIPESS